MKRIILLTLLIPVLAHAQRYGHTSAGAAGAGSTANVRANTGWTASGTLARDTLYTNYAIFGAKTFGVGGTTQAQNARAKFNVLGRAANDTLAIWSNEGNTSANGDSVVYILPNGAMSIASTTAYGGLGSSMRLNVGGDVRMEGNALVITGANAQVQLNSSAQRIFYDATNKLQFYVAGAAAHVMDDNGYVGINNAGLKSRNQGVLTVRGNGTTDSLAVFRNDKNATLDSTMMVFANGSILRRDTKQLPAGAWLATASNGAALSSSNYIVTYAFDTATAETLTVDFALPPNFIQISSVEIEVISPNTDGDSVGYAIAWLGRAADEAFNVAFSSPLSGQIDLGTTANVRKILTISGTFDNLAASDRLILKLWRDPSIDNDVAADVHLVDVRVNGNGLLY